MSKRVVTWLLVLLAMGLGIFVRLTPRFLTTCSRQARETVMAARWEQTQKILKTQYPDLSFVVEKKLLLRAFQEDKKLHQREIDAEIRRETEKLKDRYQDEHGDMYMDGVDSYYWLRLLKNLLARGHVGDRIVNGVEYDDLIGAPIDPATPKNIHLWLGWFFLRLAAVFGPFRMQEVLFFIPLFLSCVLAVFGFFVARRLGANELGAFVASVAINVSPILISRSLVEWFDTDIYNVLLPLLSFGTFLYAFDAASKLRRGALTALAGLFLAFYASTWKGWWFIFDVMLISGALFILNQRECGREEGFDAHRSEGPWRALVSFFLFTTVFVIGINGFVVWNDFIAEPLRLWHILRVTPGTMWPNVFWTVAELGSGSGAEIVRSVGGSLIFFGSMVGLLYLFIFEKRLRDPKRGFGFFCLVLWIGSTFYASLEALRFTLLLVVPLGLAYGLVVGRLQVFLSDLADRFLKKSWALIARSAVVLVLSIQIVTTVWTAHAMARSVSPTMNDDWYLLLKKIKTRTSPDARINSWWDFGHWFKGVADRRVLFDGMTQNTPYAYWMARVLLTDNEEEALGLLRMVNGSGSAVADILTRQKEMPLGSAVTLVRQAAGMPRSEASKLLLKNFPPALAQDLTERIFPSKVPPVYFIVSYDMPDKISAISYIAHWDFAKVDLWFAARGMSRDAFFSYVQERYEYDDQKAERLYLELSMINDQEARLGFSRVLPMPSPVAPCTDYGDLEICQNGLVAHKPSGRAYMVTGFAENTGVANTSISLERGVLREVTPPDANLPFSALRFTDELMRPMGVLLDPELGRSLLARLYYFKGVGLKYFKFWDGYVDDKGRAVYVYEIQWPKES